VIIVLEYSRGIVQALYNVVDISQMNVILVVVIRAPFALGLELHLASY
jgi:hypothetical protein